MWKLYGFLRDGSGSDIGRSYVDLGIGRFPARTVNQAKAIVDKVVRYIETPVYGSWKNQLRHRRQRRARPLRPRPAVRGRRRVGLGFLCRGLRRYEREFRGCSG